MKIYVASSWRNLIQPAIVHALRRCGHEVYDFRNPKPGDSGFRWQDVGGPATYQHGDKVSAERWRAMLAHPRAAEGYESDISHVRDCDAVVYVLPCGRGDPQEGSYLISRAISSGQLYIGFHPDEPGAQPDRYAYELTGVGIRMRQAGTARWFVMNR